jgi:hypothetical protein
MEGPKVSLDGKLKDVWTGGRLGTLVSEEGGEGSELGLDLVVLQEFWD